MATVMMTPELSSWIAGRIAMFPGEYQAHQWLADRVREVNALPLVLDMAGSYAIRANGELVEFDWDGPGAAKPIDDPRLVNLALYQGSLKYPDLAPLVPVRSDGATSCVQCDGTGKLGFATEPGLENVVCYCGGLGWLPPSSDR